jgi:Tol biopolymer transport system component
MNRLSFYIRWFPGRRYVALMSFLITLIFLSGCAGNVVQQSVKSFVPSEIAFEWNESIYTVNDDATGMIKISPSGAEDQSPIWSPDGSRIVFLTRNGILLPSANSNFATSATSDPFWSPNSQKLLFNDLGGIYVEDTSGNNLKTINQTRSGPSLPQWSPDSSKVLFFRSENNLNELCVADSDGGNIKVIASNSKASYEAYCWSPDGKKIAYEFLDTSFTSQDEIFKHDQIYVMNADGTNKINVSPPDFGSINPVWSPDSSKLTFWTLGNGITNLDYVNNDGSGLVEMTHFTSDIWDGSTTSVTGFVVSSSLSSVQWFSDSKRILFTAPNPTNSNHWDIYTFDSEGANITNITNDGNSAAPVLTADNSKIVFCSLEVGNNRTDVFVMSVDGSQRVNLTKSLNSPSGHSAFDQFWSVSPHGTWIDTRYLIH